MLYTDAHNLEEADDEVGDAINNLSIVFQGEAANPVNC